MKACFADCPPHVCSFAPSTSAIFSEGFSKIWPPFFPGLLSAVGDVVGEESRERSESPLRERRQWIMWVA
jgi:hypothetical protein